MPVPDRPGVLAEVTTLAGELGVNIFDLEIAHSAEGDRGVLVLVVDAAAADRRARAARWPAAYRPVGCGRLLDDARSRSDGRPRRCTGRLRVPGDKSISHRALLLAALAEGTSTLRPVRRRRRGPHRGGGQRPWARPSTATTIDRWPRPPARARRRHRRRQLRAPASGCWPAAAPASPGSPCCRRRVDRPPADGPGRRPAPRHGRPGRRPRRRPAPAARRPRRRAARHRLRRCRWPAPRSSRRCCWPASAPSGDDDRARDRCRPGPTPRRCWPLPAPTSRSATRATVTRAPSALQPVRARRARRPVPGRLLGGGRLRHRPGSDVVVERRLRRPGPERLPRRARGAWARRSTSSRRDDQRGHHPRPVRRRCTPPRSAATRSPA